MEDTTRNKGKSSSREQYLQMLQQEQDRQRQMSIISFQPQTLFEKPHKELSHDKDIYKKEKDSNQERSNPALSRSNQEPSASNELILDESDGQHLKQAHDESLQKDNDRENEPNIGTGNHGQQKF